MTYMLDTNICIYVMKNKPEKVLQRFREELDGGLCISSVTLAELEYGMKHSSNPAKNEQALLRFLAPLSILPFGAACRTVRAGGASAAVAAAPSSDLFAYKVYHNARHRNTHCDEGYYFERSHDPPPVRYLYVIVFYPAPHARFLPRAGNLSTPLFHSTTAAANAAATASQMKSVHHHESTV